MLSLEKLLGSSPSNEAETQGAVLTILRNIASVKLSINKDTKEESKTGQTHFNF